MINPKKMCVRCIIRKTARLHGIVPQNQYEPEEGGGHRIIATTSDPKKNSEAGGNDGNTQPVYIYVGRTWYSFLQAITKSRWIPVG
jgi:hypothetical protein